jgi:hypothetical protein
LARFPNPAWASDGLPRQLLDLARSYRNPAVHSEMFGRGALDELRDIVVGAEATPGLLERLTLPG